MPPRKPKPPPPTQTWITESRSFSLSVIADILASLQSETENLIDLKSLVRVESLWSQKFDGKARQPESNPRPLTPKKPRKRAPRKRAPTAKQPKTTSKSRLEDKLNIVNANRLPDERVIRHQICIPRLRPHWKLTYFYVYMPAYLIKRKIPDRYITWAMLDRLMAMDNKSGTAVLQEFMDDIKSENPL